MKNNYIIVSNDKITIDTRISRIIEEWKLKDYELIKYTYPDNQIDDVIEDLNTYNFLSNMKVIVYYNCTFLNKDLDKSIDNLANYLNNPSDNIFIMINDNINDSKDIKKIISNVSIIDSRISSEVLIKNNLENYTMDNKTVKYLAEYCLYNNEKIVNELGKIKCYKYSDSVKNITIEDINLIVLRDYDEDIFDLVNAIVNRNKSKAIDLYERISRKEKDSINIMASVSSSIRNLFCVKILLERKYKANEISTILGIKPYAVQVASENCNNYSKKKLLYFLNLLSDIDFKSKSGNGNGNSLFEMFLLSL